MKTVQNTFKTLAGAALLALVGGCASDLQDKENLAVAAGFKVITPSTPDQVALLPTLPAGKVTPITYKGKKYYALPDVKNNRAYVGGPRQFQTYQQLRLARQISNDNLMAAQMNQEAAMNFGMWGGWNDGWGPTWY